ncbi:serine hydrolase domain-containing protein [Paenibacillus chartarius]|uniref:Serine hydrolase domain-containing protein n=1 Tax=Paenibacillus chartarius TaxID=747481 RepID=A0ABV6DI44_9BACL
MLTDKIEKLLTKSAKKSKTLQFAMSLPAMSIDYSFSSTTPVQKFHSASVGKLITAVLTFKAIEQGSIALNTPLHRVLEQGVLDRLFMYEGQDYQREVTVEHLLSHTSGVNDYFESTTFDGASFIDEVIKRSDTIWMPMDLLDYTRTKQRGVGTPGQQFYYSDTGYVLLGLVLESIYGMPIGLALQKHLFEPAGMTDTCLCFHSEAFDPKQLAPMYINGTDIHLFPSLSCDFSGGGLSTTTADLLRFLRQLQNGQLISSGSLTKMAQFTHRYRQGMVYGVGMMQLRFEQFFFLLKHLPRLQGHLGVTGAHAWYDPVSGASYVLNVGNTKDMAGSFKLLIKILQLVHREQRERRT